MKNLEHRPTRVRVPTVVPCSLHAALLAVVFLATSACEENHYHSHYYQNGAGGGGGSGGTDSYADAPEPDTSVFEHQVDVFGVAGNRFWFAVSDEQRELMNEHVGPGPGPFFQEFGDIYTPGGEADATYVDHLFVTSAGSFAATADYGQVQVRVVGQSTLRPWTARSIPNLKIDMDEFQDGLSLGGYEHLRLNNALVGSIFREKLALDLYRALGYPAPSATFAWVSSNVWGPGVSIPYVLVEVYKRDFCERNAEALGGGCVNMWELQGDFGFGGFERPENCQFRECDNGRVRELEELVLATPFGEGFKAALAEWIDWPSFHRFQCLSWVLATGDDALHNQNNLVLVERADGLFQFLPYSVDISLGQEWYPEVPLTGVSTVSMGCQSDASCWADMIAVCEDVIAEFVTADPLAIAQNVYETLQAEGMLRSGDESRYQTIRAFLERRTSGLSEELEVYRDPPPVCQPPLVLCGELCTLPEECFAVASCLPPGARPIGREAMAERAICPPIENYRLE
jgi:hypothetical protein